MSDLTFYVIDGEQSHDNIQVYADPLCGEWVKREDAEKLQQRNTELEQDINQVKQHLCDYRRERIVLINQNKEPAATVERLRIAALNAISIMPSGQAKADLRDACDDTPEQNLNHVKRDCLLILARDLSSTGEIESNVIECIEIYAERKYPTGE